MLYIGREARGLGGGAKPEAAAASCSRRTPAAWEEGERGGPAWLRLGLGPVGQARIFFKLFRGKHCIEK